jgi:cobalamin biosynthetic protein CobC
MTTDISDFSTPSPLPFSSAANASAMLEHGGQLRQAAKEFKVPLGHWLDLSTGINPLSWPVDSLPALETDLWQRLPEEDDGLLEAARRYYGARYILPIPGSQAAVRHLPRILHETHGPLTVICLQPIYNELPAAWTAAGHLVESVEWQRFEDGLDYFAPVDTPEVLDPANRKHKPASGAPHILALCNPNNPSGHTLAAENVLALARQLNAQGSWLVVDEAFADSRPEISVAPYAGTYSYPRLIVLRSLGKFFGLSGLRVGFVCAAPTLLASLNDWLGPWTISRASRHIATHALNDSVWQAITQTRLQDHQERLAYLLQPLALADEQRLPMIRSTDLFSWIHPHKPAGWLYQQFAQQGILVRHYAETNTLRFGLPGLEPEWQRLAKAIHNVLELQP